jgi:hypothetical protein
VVTGSTYKYSVHAHNDSGISAKAMLTVFVGAPTDLTASVSAETNSVSLDWDYGSGLELGFVIVRDHVSIDTVLTKEFTDLNIEEGTTYNYSVYAYNEFGNSGSAMVTVFVGSTVANPIIIDKINIYPNPATDMVCFRNVPDNSRVVMIDVTGRSILEKNATELNGGLSLKPYKKGLYLIRVIHGQDVVATFKIVKK